MFFIEFHLHQQTYEEKIVKFQNVTQRSNAAKLLQKGYADKLFVYKKILL